MPIHQIQSGNTTLSEVVWVRISEVEGLMFAAEIGAVVLEEALAGKSVVWGVSFIT